MGIKMIDVDLPLELELVKLEGPAIRNIYRILEWVSSENHCREGPAEETSSIVNFRPRFTIFLSDQQEEQQLCIMH